MRYNSTHPAIKIIGLAVIHRSRVCLGVGERAALWVCASDLPAGSVLVSCAGRVHGSGGCVGCVVSFVHLTGEPTSTLVGDQGSSPTVFRSCAYRVGSALSNWTSLIQCAPSGTCDLLRSDLPSLYI